MFRVSVSVSVSVALVLVSVATVLTLAAQRPALSDAAKAFVSVDGEIVALTNARVIDGTGAAARDAQTVVMRGGTIVEVGPTASVRVPEGATVVDLTGRTVLPGLVMLHEHLYYPAGQGVYGQFGESFTRLYLAGGVTTMRTGGNMNGFMDLNLRERIANGQKVGPAIDATAPYVNGRNQFIQMRSMTGPDEARQQVAYWADMGATSFKAYMQISRAELAAVVEEAHKRGLKVTGHLCSVTYAEAAEIGIDTLEHGFFAATDFVGGKTPDVCPGQGAGQKTIAALDPEGAPFNALVKTLVDRGVSLTSTLTVFETFTPGRPAPPGLDVLAPHLKAAFEQSLKRVAGNPDSIYRTLFPKAMALELAFARAGGLLVAGTDPTGGGGVVPGFSNHRQIELLVEAGFTPLEAISIATLNGAKAMGLDSRVGSIAAGKQADLLVVRGDPSRRIEDVRQVETVFRLGTGFDPVKLVESVRGQVGYW